MGDMKINLNPQIPQIPKFEDKTKIDVRYMVIAPYVSIHIYWDEKIGEVIYDVEEPLMDTESWKHLKEIEDAMREIVNVGAIANDQTTEGVLDYVDKTARLLISELGIDVEEEMYDKMMYYLYRDYIGLNEIEAMMRDYFIEDIECNGLTFPIYIVHRKYENMRINTKILSTLSEYSIT